MRAADDREVPWGAVTLAAANVVVFAFAGDAPGYTGEGSAGQREMPSIGRLLLDVVRHGDLPLLAATLAVVVPVAASVERATGAIGVVAVYLVGGFLAGFVEVIRHPDGISVIGAFGGTTAVLAMWVVDRWRRHHDSVRPAVIVAGWLMSMAVLRAEGLPIAGAAVAAWLGLYGIGAVGGQRRARQAA